MYAYEQELTQRGISYIAGIDEAGRGPLAGPVVAAAVILPTDPIAGLNDSKKITEKKRNTLFQDIFLHADVGVGIVDHYTIDRINIFEAAKHAMALAVHDLMVQPQFLLIDGKNMKLSVTQPQLSIIKGDQKSASVAAASIIAKVTRDRIMHVYDSMFPHYAFAKHKGYPTKTHVELLHKHGVSPIHRRSFSPVSKIVKDS